MEGTLERKSLLNNIKVLTDNFVKAQNVNDIFQTVNYEIKAFKLDDTNQVIQGYQSDREIGKPESLKVKVNDKIRAFNTTSGIDSKLYFKQTLNWIGHVLEINEDHFVARLDETNNPGTYEVAEFDFEDVSGFDKKLIKLGAVFYWSVGYAVRSGQVMKESFIRFQRLPAWNLEELDTVIDQSTELRKNLKWEE